MEATKEKEQYNYYSIYNGTLNHKSTGSFTIPATPIRDLPSLQKLNDQQELISVLIPFHNSSTLELTVSDISNQELPTNTNLQVVIVCSACHSSSIKYAQEVKEKFQAPNRQIDVIKESKPGKPRALNIGLQHCKSDIIVQIVDDIRLKPNLIASLYYALQHNPDYLAAVAVGFPANLSNNSLLMQVQRVHHDYFYKNDEHSLIGRAFSFRKKLLPEGFPEETMAEDFWLELYSKDKSKGFIIVEDTSYSYKKPETWHDYLKQIDRFDAAYKQLKRKHPKLCKRYLNKKPRVKSRFINMLINDNSSKSYPKIFIDFLSNKEYSTIAKLLYLLIIMYRLYWLGIKNRFFLPKDAVFTRESSTL